MTQLTQLPKSSGWQNGDLNPALCKAKPTVLSAPIASDLLFPPPSLPWGDRLPPFLRAPLTKVEEFSFSPSGSPWLSQPLTVVSIPFLRLGPQGLQRLYKGNLEICLL